MIQGKFLDVLLARNSDGEKRAFVMPTNTAYVGDLILHDSELFTIINRAFVDVHGDLYPILAGLTTLYSPDKVLGIRWEKEEQEVSNGTEQ